MLKPWLVCSPEYGVMFPIVDGRGPMEYGCDVVHVEAETKRDALLLGVRLLKAKGAGYLRDAENPYAGIRVESQACPVHGLQYVSWITDHYECSECDALAG